MSRLPQRLATLALAAVRSLQARPPAGEVRRVLVAHHLLLGDTVLLAPLLAKIAREHPAAERYVLARPAVAPLFAARPYGFQVLPHDPRAADSLRRIRAAGPFDLAFVLGDNRYAWLARSAGARWIVGFAADRPAWKNLMVDAAQPLPSQPAALADMFAALLPGPAPAPFRVGDWAPPPGAAPRPDMPPYAVLHVGASSRLKLWPAERWAALAQALEDAGVTPVWSAGPGEAGLVEAIDPQQRHARYCGNLDLAGLWHLLAGARLLVSPDTGVAHLGKLVGVPTVALFGPGAADIYGRGDYWRDAPYRALTAVDFPCRDQKLLFRRELDWVRRCGRDEAACATPGACMAAIPFETVQESAFALIKPSSDDAP